MSSQKVLVVDDCRMTCLLLRHMFAREGIPSEAASTGGEALSRLAESSYGLVLLDIVLPEMSGVAVAREARSQLGDTMPPVYLLTGLGEEFREDLLAECAAEGVFFKPIAPSEILAVARRLVQK